MRTASPADFSSQRSSQRGMALITSLLLLVVMTIMALSMFRSYGIQERIAGNTRDKERAINAAESAQQYAETWLASGTAPVSGNCNAGQVPANPGEVCTNPLLLPASSTWPSSVAYTQFTQGTINGISNVLNSVTNGATRDSVTQAASYFKAPQFYIYDAGPNIGTPAGEIYQIDAMGYGGNQSTVAVVESTIVIGTNTPTPLTQP